MVQVGGGDVLPYLHDVTSSQAHPFCYWHVAWLVIKPGMERPFPLSAALTRRQVAVYSHILLSQQAQILPVCHAAGEWLRHTKPNRKTVPFSDIFLRPGKYVPWNTGLLSGFTPKKLVRDKTKATSKYIQYPTIVWSGSNLWSGPTYHPSW